MSAASQTLTGERADLAQAPPSSARTGACPRVTGQGIGADGAGLVLRKTITGD
jgi:hypothetical protein